MTNNYCTKYFCLLSGGLDSSYALLKFLYKNPEAEVHCVFFEYGQMAVNAERTAVQKVINFAQKLFPHATICLKIINLGDVFSWSKSAPMNIEYLETDCFVASEIENRNMVIFSILMSYIYSIFRNNYLCEGCIYIITGLRSSEMPDSSTAFFDKFKELCEIYKPKFDVYIELLDEDETPDGIISKVLNLFNSNYSIVTSLHDMTHSCYYETKTPDCACLKCATLKEVGIRVGLKR